MACSRFLKFQPIERPSWREIKDKDGTVPNVSEMITQILEYEKTWRRNKNTKQCSVVKKEMHVEFLYQIQKGEDIGVVHRDKFEKIIGIVVDKANRKQDTKQEHTDPEIALKKNGSLVTISKATTLMHKQSKMELKVHKTVYQVH